MGLEVAMEVLYRGEIKPIKYIEKFTKNHANFKICENGIMFNGILFIFDEVNFSPDSDDNADFYFKIGDLSGTAYWYDDSKGKFLRFVYENEDEDHILSIEIWEIR